MRLDSGVFENVEFFADKNISTQIYAEYIIPGEYSNDPDREVFARIDSREFESFVEFIIYPRTDKKVKPSFLLRNLKNYFINYPCEDTVTPKIRLAGKLQDKLIEYHLCNHSNQFICITPKSWKITTNHTAKFLKRLSSKGQVLPIAPTKSLFDLLRPFVNANEDEFRLFVVWLVQAFCEGSHSILLLQAAKGSGKTVLTKMIRELLDPSKASVAVMPLNVDHLLTALTNSFVVTLDNTQVLDPVASDIFCQAVTGAAYIKRVAHSTNDEAMFDLRNVVIINGIDIVPQKSDLAERCLLVTLNPITKNRKTESELTAQFENALPEILGSIFETLSCAMGVVNTFKPSRLPRMADSYLDMLCIAITLGLSEDEFERIYFANIDKINKARAEIPLVEAVREYMFSPTVRGNKVIGTATEILNRIKANYSGDKRALPPNASHFSRQLTTEHHTLHAAGFIVNIDPTPADGTHIEIIKNK